MKYLSTIITLIFLNLIIICGLLFTGNLSRSLEKQNNKISDNIKIINQQIKINEIEFNLYSNYSYLKKLNKIYINHNNISETSLINFIEINNNNFDTLHQVGIK